MRLSAQEVDELCEFRVHCSDEGLELIVNSDHACRTSRLSRLAERLAIRTTIRSRCSVFLCGTLIGYRWLTGLTNAYDRLRYSVLFFGSLDQYTLSCERQQIGIIERGQCHLHTTHVLSSDGKSPARHCFDERRDRRTRLKCQHVHSMIVWDRNKITVSHYKETYSA